jgi:hypothetical protein
MDANTLRPKLKKVAPDKQRRRKMRKRKWRERERN